LKCLFYKHNFYKYGKVPLNNAFYCWFLECKKCGIRYKLIRLIGSYCGLKSFRVKGDFQ